jgi:hypothetical protein
LATKTDRAQAGRHWTAVTPRPIRPTTVLTLAGILALTAGVLARSAEVVTAADGDDASTEDASPVEPAVYTAHGNPESMVRPASYSKGAGGHTLTWLPVRPSRGQASRRPATRVAEYRAEPAGQTVRPEQEGDPFADPFGDADRLAQDETLSPPSRFDFDLRQPDRSEARPSPYEPTPMDLLPELEAESSEESERIIEDKELDDALAERRAVGLGKCPTARDLKGIHELKYVISPPDEKLPEECHLEGEFFQPRTWAPITYTWKASGLCHKPVYFEDVHLERYGHSWGCIPQPLFSAAHFFLNVPVLPYTMGLCTPKECVYTLGYYRPGSCAPYMLDPLPLSVRAGLFQAGAWVAGPFAIP